MNGTQALVSTGTFEIIDAKELARRLCVPATWVKEGTRSRTTDPIPHLRLGIYVRFEWGSPALNAWLGRHRRGAENDSLRGGIQLKRAGVVVPHRPDADQGADRDRQRG